MQWQQLSSGSSSTVAAAQQLQQLQQLNSSSSCNCPAAAATQPRQQLSRGSNNLRPTSSVILVEK
jgi:hypothetical protein